MLGEQLVDRELDQRQVIGRRVDVVAQGAEDEERDDVEGRIGLEPLPQRAHVVGGAAGDVQHAHAVSGDLEGEQALVVVGDLVAGGLLDGDLDDARASAIEGDGKIDGAGA